MPDESPLTPRRADPSRADFPAAESGLEFIMERIAALPTRGELARLTLVITFAAAVVGIVGMEAFWRYAPARGS